MKKYILLFLLGITGTLNAQPNIELAVEGVSTYPGRFKWCSAAVAECVLKYHNKNYDQCEIMDYLRTAFNIFGGNAPNANSCCGPDHPGFSHPCDQGVPLGFKNEQVSVKHILWHFGNIPSKTDTIWMNTYNFEQDLIKDQPPIVQWYLWTTGDAHVVVVCGITDWDHIHYMDPADGKITWDNWNSFMSNNDHCYVGALRCESCTRDLPCHCFNGEQDGDETGLDCGGSCPECYIPPPPPPGCDNCIKDQGEEQIDCGGPNCPPCEDVPQVRTITNTNQLRSKTMAFKRITASGATTVASGKNISFITEEDGAIVLLPGFTAATGSTFSTQRWEDLSGYSRICGDPCISKKTFPPTVCRDRNDSWFYIDNLLNAVQFRYNICDIPNGDTCRFIYGDVINVSHNGRVILWDGKTGAINTHGEVTYFIYYSVTFCYGTPYNNADMFVVKNCGSKSLTEESEEPEDLDTPQFSSSDNLKIQDKMSAPSLSIIPNPNPGVFQLEANFPLSDIADFKITNFLGVSVYETKNLVSNTIQLQNSASGMFFVVIVLKDGNMLTQKMMVQR